MKGTPLGHTRKRRIARAGVGSAVAALTLASASQGAAGSTLEVTRTATDGRGSLRAAVEKANAGSGADRIVFARGLRGSIRLEGSLHLRGDLVIEGNGYGTRKGKRFGRVKLVGPGGGDRIELDGGSEVALRDLYLRRAPLRADSSELTVHDSHLSGDGVARPGVDAYLSDARVFDSTINGFNLGMKGITSSLRIDRTTISGNHGDGGIYVADYGGADITNSTISGNTAEAQGGDSGIGGGMRTVYHSGIAVANSTITGNAADGPESMGGGIYGDVAVINSTITDNAAASGGGIMGAVYYDDARLANSIVFGNKSTGGGADDCAGPVVSRGGNLLGDSGTCVLTGTDLSGVSPELGPLAANGGPTRTHALGKGSPAAGLAVKRNATKFDQRGVRRGSDPDSGAYER